MNRPVRIMLALFVALLALSAAAAGRPQPAAAGGPGVWTDLSGPVGSLLVQPDAARGGGGVLHVVWATSGTTDDLVYRPVAASGVAGTRQVLASGWPSLNNPAIVYSGGAAGEVGVFSGGQSPGDVQDGLVRWYSTDNGATFAPMPGVISGPGGLAYQSPMAAVVTSQGTFEAWFNSSVVVHKGVVPGADYNVNDAGADGWCPAFGYDGAADRLSVVWASNATGASGLRVRPIDQSTGAAAGPSFELANSTTLYAGHQEFSLKNMRTPVTGLAGQSVVVVAYPTGYPTSTTMRVWRLTPSGQSNVVLASGGSEKDATAVAADASGRVWVVWTDKSSARRRVCAVRSNVGATAWGQIVSLAGPSGASTLWQLAAAAQSDRVDVLAQYQQGTGNDIFHTQLLAGLTVKLSPVKVKAGKTVTVKVTVLDAGVAVPGAKATIGTKSATTSSTGVAKVKVKATKAGKLSVTVKKSGYAKGSATLKVTR
jgi:hypothetical protein